MTAVELQAIVDGIVPFLKERLAEVTQRAEALALEVSTVREALRAAEGRRVDLERRCQALEAHVKALRLELEADRAVWR